MRVITRSYKSITRSYRREREGVGEKEKLQERKRSQERKRRSWNNRFRLIRNRMKRRMKRRKRNGSGKSPFSMTISTLIFTSTTPITILISTINLNLTLFEPHSSPPFHSPRTLQCPLSSPHTLSPHSIPLVTFNFISITFCYESKSP